MIQKKAVGIIVLEMVSGVRVWAEKENDIDSQLVELLRLCGRETSTAQLHLTKMLLKKVSFSFSFLFSFPFPFLSRFY